MKLAKIIKPPFYKAALFYLILDDKHGFVVRNNPQ